MEILCSIIFNDSSFMYDVTVHSVLRNRAGFQTKKSFLYINGVQAYVSYIFIANI